MQFSNLERNIVEVIEEQQAKLGYDGNAVHLFYPLASLNTLLETTLEEEGMQAALGEFAAFCRERLGEIEISCRDARFSLLISPEGSAYVHEHMREDTFIVRLVHLVSRHGATIDEVLALFHTYADSVHFEQMKDNPEFDYLLYFEQGVPDAFYYCFKADPMHMTYHRFTREDYESFGF